MTEIFEAVRKDIADEHAAIIQYLYHAYSTPDEEIRGKLESIARDEMRHFKWLNEWLVKHGQKPAIERSSLVSTGTLKSLIEADIKAEIDAISQYIDHKAMTDDKELIALIDRIIADERSHRTEFEKLLEELESKASAESDNPSGPSEGPALGAHEAALLQQALEHEYTSLLQYLYHYFTTGGSDEYEDFSIDEMKHFGWFAEALAERGYQPLLEHKVGEVKTAPEDAAKSNLSLEEEAIRKFSEAREKIRDGEVKEIFELALEHENYHAFSLKKMLEKLEKASGKKFTVGSLKELKDKEK
ncbi:bacterioferritin [Caldanaerovirga acetigignens]|uniref:Bacterioferritin n=1 Tax=Caldanaerovirga acetigignens TaxID=447595 RepID=A0A1M7LGY2_9FIRM|nr:ferritin-like domain-containing protein [Caldanaerovirga acetigignens]SHM77197.1 bacterioferritin [Caldanaerovirga acetigignens]